MDIIIKAAAVSDYRPAEMAANKLKKNTDELRLTLKKTEDILSALGQRKKNQILVGFAAETEDLKQNAQKKLKEKNCDIIVGNLVGPSHSGFGSDTNQVTLFFKDGSVEALDVMEKEAVARILLDRVKERFF
jgi:phosphopantothenoylcysteine decarboxylase/phosphopantothenate--cysteine ligase